MRTYSPKPDDITRAWHIVDADGLVLGRLATEVAAVLRGKHKPTFAPHVDTGDHVIVVNADKVVLTSGKAESKMSYRHSGYPGGLTATTYADLMIERADDVVRDAIRGMLPKNRLGRQMKAKYPDKVVLTSGKADRKISYRHSGYPGGLRATSYADLLDTDPRKAVEKAVKGMLPHNKLGRQVIKKLKVYSGPNHPHTAQQPQPFEITQVAQ